MRLSGPALVVAVLVGCGDVASEGGMEPSEARGEPIADCAPRVLEHRYGETRLEGAPERIVPVTVRDQDVVLAFDRIPVAIQDGYYRLPYTSWPWVPTELQEAGPTVLSAERLNVEQVAALRPDLIVGAASGMTEDEYRLLSRIAPTLAQSKDHMDYGVPWDELTRTVGSALCQDARADSLVDATRAHFDRIREEHPELRGKVGVVAMPGGPDGAHWAYGPEDSRGRLIARLGFEHPAELEALASDHFVAVVSRERLDLFDVDVLVWLATPAQQRELEADPVYRDLEVVREDRVIYLEPDGPLVAALTNTTPLSLPYALEAFVPRLLRAVGATPASAEPSPRR